MLKLDPSHAGAKRARALAMYGAARFGLVPREQAFAELAQVAEEQPGNVSLAETLVRVYREEWTSLEAADRSQQADRVMDRLVASAPNNIDTYLARYRYRTRYGLPGVDADIAELQQRGPQEPQRLGCGCRMGHEMPAAGGGPAAL